MEKELYIYQEREPPRCINQAWIVNEELLGIASGAGVGLEENVIMAIEDGYKIILDDDNKGGSQPLPKEIKDKILPLLTK